MSENTINTKLAPCTCKNHEPHDHNEHLKEGDQNQGKHHLSHEHNHSDDACNGHCHCENDTAHNHSDDACNGHCHCENDTAHNHSDDECKDNQDQCTCTDHHEHSHENSHTHKTEESSCGCAMCGLEDLSHEAISADENKDELPDKIKLPVKFLITGGVIVLTMLVACPAWLELILMGGITLLWGWELIWEGLKGLFHLRLDENSLMAIAVIAAFVLGEYTEALLVTLLFSIGEMLEEKAVKKSRKDIAAVVNIRPQTANRIDHLGDITVIPSKEIRVDDILLIKVGERVPVDCLVLEGESALDQSALTGEAIAVGVQKDDEVLSGAVNLSQAITCRAVTTFEGSTASRIIKLVEESATQKGQTERLITRFAKIYTPLIVVCALIVAIFPPLLGFGTFYMWLMRSLVFLVAACPCALVISVPLGLYSGVGAISKQGVLIKGTKFLEPLAKAETVVFDKTGTITTGALTLSTITELGLGTNLFRISAIAESYSNHPMAQAITKAYELKEGKVDLSGVSQVEEIAGKGVKLLLDGKQVLCGSARLMEENQINVKNLPKANVYTSLDKEVLGYLILSDIPREEAEVALSRLKNLGVKKTVMLTGDSQSSAEIVQKKVGIDEIHYDLLPEDKAKLLYDLKQNSKSTVFVGDGINDAPVIAAADVGFAMGLGSDAAIESADAVLMSEKLTSLADAIQTARKTIGIVQFNIWFILLVKAVVFILGIFGYANMWMAVFADVGLSILTVLNSVRVLRI